MEKQAVIADRVGQDLTLAQMAEHDGLPNPTHLDKTLEGSNFFFNVWPLSPDNYLSFQSKEVLNFN